MGKSIPRLDIELLGPPRLTLNGQPVETLRRKNRALLFYLAAKGKIVTRDHLLAFFWPDSERADAQPILRTMLHDLRKVLGETIEANGQSIGLAPPVQVDTRAFSATQDDHVNDLSRLTSALALYKGDFLEGFSLGEPAQFDDWVESERERFRLAAMHGYARIARCHEDLKEYPAALEALRQALKFNPFQEDIQRDLMRVLYLNGDRPGVIRQYEALRTLLDQEMGVPPMPETRSLYDSILNETLPPPPNEAVQVPIVMRPFQVEPGLPFIGRQTELDSISAQIGQGRLMLLEGEAGIGKTRLFSELVAEQNRRSGPALVLQGAAFELEQGLPYQPVIEALRELHCRPEWASIQAQLNLGTVWLTELSRLLPELLDDYPQLPPPPQPADQARLWEALLQFLTALSRKGPVWLFLDDLHWADAASLGWLGYLVRHADPTAVALFGSSRPIDGQMELTRLVQSLLREDRLFRLPLLNLPDSAIQQLAVSISDTHQSPLSDWLIGNTEGNPFFLTELIRYAHSVGLLKIDGGLDIQLFDSSPAIPATIQNLIESRLLRLSEPSRNLIHLAGIIGREFDLELLRQAAALPEAQVLDGLEELQSAHLIRPLQGERFTFDHSLTMQVTLQDMTEARRHSLHRQVAAAIESVYSPDLGPQAGLLARHSLEGNLPAQAAIYSFRAGQHAASLAAWTEAIAFYEQAHSLEHDPGSLARIYLAMGTARFHKGDFGVSSRDYRTSADLALAEQDWPLMEAAHLALNQSFLPQARFREAIELARELRQSGPPELAACAEFCWGTGLGVESAHPVEAEAHLREAERMVSGQPAGSTMVTLPQIRYQLAGVVGQLGQSIEAIAMYRQVLTQIEAGQATLDILRHIMLYNNLAYHLHLVGDPAAAETIQTGLQLAREKGSLSHISYLYSTSGEIAMDQGNLDEAESYFREGLAVAKQIPVPERIAGMTANLGLVARRRGEDLEAVRLLKEALELAQKVGSHHLEVRIRIWLAPMLPSDEARKLLGAAHSIAEQEGLQSLLADIRTLENNLNFTSH